MAIAIIPIWKEAPFIRLLIPFIMGIMLQWYFQLPYQSYWIILTICITGIFLFGHINAFKRYRYYWLAGLYINVLLFNCGGLFTYYSNAGHQLNRNNASRYHNAAIIVTLEEPLSEKARSFKANAAINYFCKSDSLLRSNERIILYFEKDSCLNKISFNSRLIFRKPLTAIRNTGNPGAFNYEHYCALQGIYRQVYLKKNDYNILPAGDKKIFRKFLFSSLQRIVAVMQKYIPGEKEAGLAEALLIGYKDDLDKSLVKSYSNTGVVHIIAISGLHVGLIYWMLNLLLYPLGKRRGMRWLRAILVISGLWLFGFLAGGSASVLRSTLMFTFIVTGENVGRKTGIYNSLAASAFLLLCYNPLWLWDAGFLLSYIAVLSIVVFMKRVYNWIFIGNKLLDTVWKMVAISASAQILTTPLSIFLFHQFPIYFLITNLVAVPLSSLILIAELVLCAGAYFPLLAKAAGCAVYWLISIMNGFVKHINGLPFSTWDQLQFSVTQVILIYTIISATACWLFWKKTSALIVALVSCACVMATRSVAIVQARHQRKLIVYNVPHHLSIDLLYANSYCFIGDKEMVENTLLRDLYLKPAHCLYRVDKPSRKQVMAEGNSFYFSNKRILIIDKPLVGNYSSNCVADIVVFSGNPDISIRYLIGIVSFKHLVFDGSNSLWKVKQWQKDCKKYGVSCYSVLENGAFILNMN